MRKVSRLGLVSAMFAALLVGFGFVTATQDVAEARPQYKKAFAEVYGEKIEKVDCKICHPKESKKIRNAYGTAFKKALDKPNEKDAGKIKDALEKVEKEKSKVDGKTFGDLIEEGKSPGTE